MAGLMAGSRVGWLGVSLTSGGAEGFLTEEVTNAAGADLAQGEVVRMSADDTVVRAQANAPANVQGTIGVTLRAILNGTVGPVVSEGKAVILLEAGLVPPPVAGDTLWVSAAVAGRATNVAPAANPLTIGVIKDASSYAVDSTVVGDVDVASETSFTPVFAAPAAAVDIGDAAVEGVATTFVRSDHQHAVPAPVAAPPAIASAGAVGAATTPARSDHTHEGVHQIIAGTGISVAPAGGTGDVTVTATSPSPGTQRTIGSGSTAIADGTVVTVGTFTRNANERLWYGVWCVDNTANTIFAESVAAGIALSFFFERTAVANQFLARVRNTTGTGAKTVEWVVIGIVP